jgi:L-phenylalanine/L-methionine N-acetyltransferase
MNIHIRYVQPQDHAAIHGIFTSPHVINGTMRIPHQSFDSIAKRLEPNDEIIKLVACVEDDVVGYAELITHPSAPRHRHAAELNMVVVHADWQGKGIGSALMSTIIDLTDNWLQITRVGLVVWNSNEGAVKLYQKYGFVLEGTLKQFVFREGTYEDAYLMARIKPSQTE